MDEQKEIPVLKNGIKIGKVTKIELVNGRINLWAEINKNEIKNKIYERFNGLRRLNMTKSCLDCEHWCVCLYIQNTNTGNGSIIYYGTARANGEVKIDMSAYQDEILPKLCGQYKKAKD